MTTPLKIYLLDPKKLSPEVIAVTFAKTSRSPQSFQEIADELTDEKSAEFNEKWVVGYGHASVAEHAVLHIAVENLSRLAVEALESSRLASYTEKSTRYQKWGSNSFHLPAELDEYPNLKNAYLDTSQMLFEAYLRSLPKVQEVVAQEMPRGTEESQSTWERRTRTEYVDVCRFFLPACAFANVGVTINARNLEHSLAKLLSHPLAEVRTLGAEMKQIAAAELPTLIKYANPQPYLQKSRQQLHDQAMAIPVQAAPTDWCTLLDYNPHGDETILAAALFRFGNMPFPVALQTVQSASPQERSRMVEALMGGLGSFDIPLRELEYASFTFDVVLDQGAFLELKRHRMMTLTPQRLTPDNGYALPRRMAAAGLEAEFRHSMQAAAQTYQQIAAELPEVAAYVLPNAFNRRALLQMNFRTAYHFLRLRSATNAHFSMRRVARRMAEQIQNVSPLLGSRLELDPCETWQSIQADYFNTWK